MFPLPCFLLAAGLGTRLGPLTEGLPKALVPLGDRPLLEHLVEHLLGGTATLRRPLVANAFHQAALLRASAPVLRGDVLLSEEPHLLGTAGGLAFAAGALGPGPALVWNADMWSELDPAALVGEHLAREAQGGAATLAVAPAAPGDGNVGWDDDGRVVRLRRETVRGGESTCGWFLGIHVVGAELRATAPKEGCLVGDLYLPALRRGISLGVQVTTAETLDVGGLPSYLAAHARWLARKNRDAFVGAGAQVDPTVALRRAVVGAGARVSGHGTLEDVVVWPGAVAHAPLERAVVLPDGNRGRVIAVPRG